MIFNCEQDYSFRLELSKRSDTKRYTSRDNNNNNFCRRQEYMLESLNGVMTFTVKILAN